MCQGEYIVFAGSKFNMYDTQFHPTYRVDPDIYLPGPAPVNQSAARKHNIEAAFEMQAKILALLEEVLRRLPEPEQKPQPQFDPQRSKADASVSRRSR